MPQRYFFAVPIPQEIQPLLNRLCREITGQDSPVRFMHISIVPPFMVKAGVTVDNIQVAAAKIPLSPFTAHTGSLGVFHQRGKHILYVNIEPKQEFGQINAQLTVAVLPHIQPDTTPYTNGKIPSYDAHTTLDYNVADPAAMEEKLAAQAMPVIPPKIQISWTVEGFGLYKEMGQGIWEEV